MLDFASMHSSDSMKAYVEQVYRKLKEQIEDAVEWANAPAALAAQSLTDWEILCHAVEEPCPHGDACIYASAATEVFRAHPAGFSAERACCLLARSLGKWPI